MKKNIKEEKMIEKSEKVPQHKLKTEHRSKKRKDGTERRSYGVEGVSTEQ